MQPDIETQLGENWRRAGKLIAQSFNEQTQTLTGLVVLPNDTDTRSGSSCKTHPFGRAKHSASTLLS